MTTNPEVFKLMKDDAYALAVVSAIEEAVVTEGVFNGVARWFDDVEIVYPIAVMEIGEDEKRTLTNSIAVELTTHFNNAYNKAKEGNFTEADFHELALKVDPLWRELTGVYAKELNDIFHNTQTGGEDPQEIISNMLDVIRSNFGEEGVNDFKNRAKTDRHFRAQLRRMGVNPDAL